jgi:hypothetical protein
MNRIEADGSDSDVTTALLFAPAVGDATASVCATLSEFTDQPLDRVVPVTVTQSASDWLRTWERVGRSVPVTCVDVDGDTRSAAGPAVTSPSVPVERVSDPTDLEAVGRQVSDVLQDAADDGERVGVTVHSLTGVLQHVDEATAFKFVYTLGEIVRQVGGVVVFHLDRDAHADETVETFSVACDAAVELDRPLATCDGGRD